MWLRSCWAAPALDIKVGFWVQQGIAKSNVMFSFNLFCGGFLSFLQGPVRYAKYMAVLESLF
jgi:hypothetical protein